MSSGVSPVRFLMVSSVTLMISCAVLLRNFRSLSMYGFVETINVRVRRNHQRICHKFMMFFRIFGPVELFGKAEDLIEQNKGQFAVIKGLGPNVI